MANLSNYNKPTKSRHHQANRLTTFLAIKLKWSRHSIYSELFVCLPACLPACSPANGFCQALSPTPNGDSGGNFSPNILNKKKCWLLEASRYTTTFRLIKNSKPNQAASEWRIWWPKSSGGYFDLSLVFLFVCSSQINLTMPIGFCHDWCTRLPACQAWRSWTINRMKKEENQESALRPVQSSQVN